jgi:alkaline phosphatase
MNKRGMVMSNLSRIFFIGFAATVLSLSVYHQAISKPSPPATAQNIILLISDGAGFNTFEAGNSFQFGEKMPELYKDFSVKIASKTDMLNFVDKTTNDPVELDASDLVCPGCKFNQDCSCDYSQWHVKPQGYNSLNMWKSFNYIKEDDNYLGFTGSAAAATALYTGVKTTRGRLGMTWDEVPLPGIAEIAHALGKSTGVVSSVQLSHATPGAVWSHKKNRNMYADIANEMIYYSGLDVIMGCGDPMDGTEYKYVGGEKTWADITDKNGANGFFYIHDVSTFENLAKGRIQGGIPVKVIGIPHATRTLSDNPGDVPTLETMVMGAIRVLSRNPKGFFLMIEGGAVDWKNHYNDIDAMVKEQASFNNTVAAVKKWVEIKSAWKETLVIVTSDHECGMLWGPGTYTDNDCGQADKCTAGYYDSGIDTFNGWHHIKNNGKDQIPGVQYGSKGHTRALVPVFAKGLGAEMLLDLVDGVDAKAGSFWGFSGQYIDNTDIFTVMAAAMNPRMNHSEALWPAIQPSSSAILQNCP